VGVAPLLGGPRLHGDGEFLLLRCPRRRDGGEAWRGEMDRSDGLGLVSGEPGGDPRAEITAVRDVAIMTQARCHQGVPEPRHLPRGQPGRRRRPAESKPRQRWDDHREGVGRVRTVSAWVAQLWQHVDVLEK
jgi:hypothetical protein